MNNLNIAHIAMLIMNFFTHSAASFPKEAAIASLNDPLEAPANDVPKIPLLPLIIDPDAPIRRGVLPSGEVREIAIGSGILVFVTLKD